MRIIRITEVCARTGLSRPTIYRRMAEETFPRQRRLGANSVGWDEDEVDAWLADCPEGPLPAPKAVEVRRGKVEEAHAT